MTMKITMNKCKTTDTETGLSISNNADLELDLVETEFIRARTAVEIRDSVKVLFELLSSKDIQQIKESTVRTCNDQTGKPVAELFDKIQKSSEKHSRLNMFTEIIKIAPQAMQFFHEIVQQYNS